MTNHFAECLARYAAKRPKHFLQLDCFHMEDDGDDVMRPDTDGDAMFAGHTTELMNGADVRVLIPEGADVVSALRMLRKLADWLERDGEAIRADITAGDLSLLEEAF